MTTLNTSPTRISLLEVDDVAPVRAPVAPAPLVLEAFEGAGRAGDIDPEGRARALAGAKLADVAGLAFSEPTFFVAGTQGQWGDKAKAARLALDSGATLRELAQEARTLVSAEGRRGDVVGLAGLTYGTDDRVRTRVGSTGAKCSPQALKQLMARANAPGGGYLANGALSGELRAPHVAHWLGRAVEADTDAEIKLLSKIDAKTGQRGVYGTVGPRFPHDYGMDRVIADLAKVLPEQARGALVYDASSTRWRVDAAIGAPIEITVGEIHRLGIKFGAHDAGGGAYYATLYGVRARCVNFSEIQLTKKLGRVRHIGSAEALRERILELVTGADEAMKAYVEVYRESHEAQLAADESPRDVFAALIKRGYITAPGGDTDVAIDNFMHAWEQEPMRTRAGYLNAVTRAAHESVWSSPWVTDELEAEAGQALYQRVTLDAAAFA